MKDYDRWQEMRPEERRLEWLVHDRGGTMGDGPAHPKMEFERWAKLSRKEKMEVWRREQLDPDGNIRLRLPIQEFAEYAEEAQDEADWKHLVCCRRFYVWPSEIAKVEFILEGDFMTILAVMKNTSADFALPEQPAAEQLAAARGETITQTVPNGYEVSGVRPTPETSQDWRPF